MLTKEELLSQVTTEDVIKLLQGYNADYKNGRNGEIIFKSVCHDSDSYKLYYYPNSQSFMCYSCCGSLSLLDFIMRMEDCEFREAIEFLANFIGISISKGHKKRVGLISHKRPLEEVERYKKRKELTQKYHRGQQEIIQLPSYNEGVLDTFFPYYPNDWYELGINEEVAYDFGIGMNFGDNCCTIPHRDIYGNLVGIKCRNFDQALVDRGLKYIPITVNGLTYRYPQQYNLYGIWQNKGNIKRLKKAIIFESEKSVLLYGSMFGQENNIALALCGTTLSKYQVKLLLSLEVKEVVIAIDKQYKQYIINGDYDEEHIDKDTKKDIEEYNNYFKKLIKYYSLLGNYVSMSVIFCEDNRLDYKDSPIDKGKEVFCELNQENYVIVNEEELSECLIM